MKKVFLIIALGIVLASCSKTQVYSLSTLDGIHADDINTAMNWNIVVEDKNCPIGYPCNLRVEDIRAHQHTVGDTIEIIFNDSTSARYTITAIKQ